MNWSFITGDGLHYWGVTFAMLLIYVWARIIFITFVSDEIVHPATLPWIKKAIYSAVVFLCFLILSLLLAFGTSISVLNHNEKHFAEIVFRNFFATWLPVAIGIHRSFKNPDKNVLW
jgi:hypothetical protein